MVSSELPRYRADIVRLIHGDTNPNGPGLKETEIDTPVSGEYDGQRQELPFGSYVLVPDDPALRLRGSFTVTAWIAPTTPGVSFGERSAQGIVTKWSDDGEGGYGVFILVGATADHQHAAEDHHTQPLAVHGGHTRNGCCHRVGIAAHCPVGQLVAVRVSEVES